MSPSEAAAVPIGVRDLILQRSREGSRPGARRDPYRVALCIEGGAMRGVVSAGMVVAIEQLGLLNAFDCIYGSSAGAMNAAFLMAGQAAFGTTIYYENINNRSFIDFRRLIGPRPVVDIDFVVWNVMRGPKRLDVPRVFASGIDLRAVATDTTSGERVSFGPWADEDDFLACLRAGATMPIVAGPPYMYRGKGCWDALLSEPIPARIAEEEGCTHLMVLLTRPPGTAGPRLSPGERIYVLPRLRSVSTTLADRYEQRARQYVDLLDVLCTGRGPLGRAVALAVAPELPTVGKLERNRERLVAGAKAGMRAVITALGYDSPAIHETLAFFGQDGHAVPAGTVAESPRDDSQCRVGVGQAVRR